jgi:hypothetical protein
MQNTGSGSKYHLDNVPTGFQRPYDFTYLFSMYRYGFCTVPKMVFAVLNWTIKERTIPLLVIRITSYYT